ncbi:glycosyltransferase family 61 protein [archaeon]|nr:MAG: glycosyltransferase family 61 protein [archaeon]
MLIMYLLVFQFMVYFACGIDYVALDQHWQQEMHSSLQKNVIRCGYHITNQSTLRAAERNKPRANNSFEVYPIYPTEEMIDYFTTLKLQLTKAHHTMLDIADRYNNINNVTFSTEDRHFWAIPPDAPGQNFSNCFRLLSEAVGEQPITIYDSYHHPLHRSFYYLRIEKAIVYFDGAVGASCGLFLGAESCSSRLDHNSRCQQRCFTLLQQENLTWYDLWQSEKYPGKPMIKMANVCSCLPGRSHSRQPMNASRVDQVFVASARWDQNYYHFHMDSLARLVHYLPFLRENPKIKIHLFEYENFEKGLWNNEPAMRQGRHIRHRVLTLLGLNSSRIVTNAVYANVVYIPRATHCSHPASNPLEIHLLARELLQGAYAYLARTPSGLPRLIHQLFMERNISQFNATAHYKAKERPSVSGTKILLLLQREDTNDRKWSCDFTYRMHAALEKTFPEHKVIKITSKGHNAPNFCAACEIFLFSLADVFVAEHGAGIANIMFMRPGGLLIETVSNIDDRHLPKCGYYNALSGGLGIHHYIYAYRNPVNALPGHIMNFTDFASTAAQYYRNITFYDTGKWGWFHAA